MNREKVFRILTSIWFLFSIAIVALIIILLIELVLNDIPEKFEKGSEIGNIVYKLCLAYISSFIFYFLVVHLKKVKDRHILEPYISGKVRTIIHSGKILIRFLVKATETKIDGQYPTQIELEQMCLKIDPNSFVDGFHETNWLQLFEFYQQKSESAINSVYEKIPFIDSKLVRYLGDIQNNPHYYSASNRPKKIGNKNLEQFSKHLSQYLSLIKELEIFAEKKLIGYKPLKIDYYK
ncbi:MAG TPA: hypothetical protein VJ945_00480 [Flavobacteriaceae bacterium]|nr:hypothetical protein [Flavobacteriaceae bacterium]